MVPIETEPDILPHKIVAFEAPLRLEALYHSPLEF